MTPIGSEHLPPRGAFGPTFRRDAIATNQSASVPTSTEPATWSSGSSTRSSSVVGSQRATTSLRPTTLPSSSSRQYGSGCALMSPRPRRKSGVSPRCVTAGRTLERRHCLPGLHQHRVEVTAASALPSDLHRQLDDRGGDLRQCLNALCPEFRFGHGGLSRFGFERCHGSSGAVRTDYVCSPEQPLYSPRW